MRRVRRMKGTGCIPGAGASAAPPSSGAAGAAASSAGGGGAATASSSSWSSSESLPKPSSSSSSLLEAMALDVVGGLVCLGGGWCRWRRVRGVMMLMMVR